MAIPSNVREKVFARDHFRCSVCGRFLNRSTAQVSHIKPLAEGGTDDEAFLQSSIRTQLLTEAVYRKLAARIRDPDPERRQAKRNAALQRWLASLPKRFPAG